MSQTNRVTITLNKRAVINQYPEMVVKGNYLATDTFEDGLEYGLDTLQKEPPLNRVYYMFPGGASLMYLGDDEWVLESNIDRKDAIVEAIRKIIPDQNKSR